MSQLYVTEFTLMEFRSFADLRVALPAEPGVMIVHGTNGLGKSSLFDGLEWALTGKIDHFRDSTKGVSPKDYLRRWHAPNDRPTQVSLAFSDAEKVTRTLPSGLAKLSRFDSVTAYLDHLCGSRRLATFNVICS
jgi:exonuclease SbcC